jgi:hypothetical protein
MAKRNQNNRRNMSHVSGGITLPPLSGNLIMSGGHFAIRHKNPYMMIQTTNPGARTIFRIQEETINLGAGVGACHTLVGYNRVTSTIYTSSMVIPRYSRIDAVSVRMNETMDDDGGSTTPRYISQIGLTGALNPTLRHGSDAAPSLPSFFFSSSHEAGPYPQDMILSASGQRAVYYPWNEGSSDAHGFTHRGMWTSASYNQFLHTASAPVVLAFTTNKTGSGAVPGNFSFCIHYTTYGAPTRSGSVSPACS